MVILWVCEGAVFGFVGVPFFAPGGAEFVEVGGGDAAAVFVADGVGDDYEGVVEGALGEAAFLGVLRGSEATS